MTGDTGGPRAPASTYRLQLNAGFTLDDARAVLPYLAALGVTHIYLSPITTAMPGSVHGYDVVDPTRINPELGGEQGYWRFVEEQRRLGLEQVLDIVPNHMAVGDSHNPWWTDVLRHGEESAYAGVFAIRWEPAERGLRGRVLLPVLGDTLDAVIERGELQVERTPDGWWLRYFDRCFPLRPESAEALDREGPPEDPDALRRLLDVQHYRLGYWETAKRHVNYRRFFLIDELVGLRTEEPRVFDLVHGLIRRLVAEGAVEGLRVDHPDGLADPEGYLARLREQTGARYVAVEKILERDETLPEGWQCDGATGYEFMSDLTALFIHSAAEGRITAAYRRFTGRRDTFEEIAYRSRREITDADLAGQLNGIAGRLFALAEGERRGVSEYDFARAVRLLVAGLPVYRTYHRLDRLDPRAPQLLSESLARALQHHFAESGDAEPAETAEEADTLPAALDLAAELLSAPPLEARLEVLSLQQLMPAVQAKGIEDTAFYRYHRLLSLNEVGCAPDRFGAGVHQFHERNARRHRGWPATMLASATHDHKRGEDVRARINVLSEMPEEWAGALERWSALNEAARAALGEGAPDHHDEYLLYQTLLGMWPPAPPSPAERATLVERVQSYMVKALREGDERTSWIHPDERYEAAVVEFVAHILDEQRSHDFLRDFQRLHAKVARLGAVNGLAQVLLKIASPGVPDTYQGAELWDLSLVDPDNRRPVDYGVREDALRPMLEARERGHEAIASLLGELLASWPDGRVKLYLLASALRARREHPALFIDGDYVPLEVEGALANHVVAFARRSAGRAAVAVAARLPASVTAGASLWTPDWRDTALLLPDDLAGREATEAVTLRPVRLAGRTPLRDLLDILPAALTLSQ